MTKKNKSVLIEKIASGFNHWNASIIFEYIFWKSAKSAKSARNKMANLYGVSSVIFPSSR
ncbi:hypothetical protein HYN56_12670 [Flavobacterium crocinum]|uniref:Uncharacterized protein n=1 Tax=Flavobacterium crocinum TaxID=2183896 RepID=A0A2S1YLT5_9FLAO|nr:hypothetical protein HYN56_12670 [Flavobacterium crocinum]